MKYLKKVTIENFQSHKKSVIEFDQGLNIIIGPSDSGKSAIIRAIKWALYNEPAGDYFIREGEKEASVILEFSNNIKIKRLRSKSKNAYILYNNDAELVFEGFGNKVPQEIIDLIGIEKIPLDTNESNAINLGEQLEGAFLLSEKGSTRASAIGRLVGVNLIDDALKDTLKDLRNNSIEKKNISESIKSLEEELVTFDYLDTLKETIYKLEDLSDKIKRKTEIKNQLIRISDSYEIINKDYDRVNLILYNLINIELLEKNVYILENKNKDLNLYKKLNRSFTENKKQLSYNTDIVIKLVDNKVVEKLVEEISKNTIKINNLEKNNNKMIYFKKQINQNQIDIENLKLIDLLDEKLKIIEENIKTFKKLKILNDNLNSLYKSINIGENYLMKLQNLETADSLLIHIKELTDKTTLIIKSSKSFEKTKIEINQQTNILKDITVNIDNNLKEYKVLLKENETCPFCLSEINEDKINHIIEHYS